MQMIEDIVDRLRAGIRTDDGNPLIGRPPGIVVFGIMTEAADEIERLRQRCGEKRTRTLLIQDPSTLEPDRPGL